jgi:hypothetical protein
MLIGLIMFISIFKSEIYHKVRATSSTLEPLFTFHYGHSFILYVIGFVFVELAGILNVCLFNKLQKEVMNFNQVHESLQFLSLCASIIRQKCGNALTWSFD